MKNILPKSVVVVDLEIAPFNNAEQAKIWACGHGIPGLMSGQTTERDCYKLPNGVDFGGGTPGKEFLLRLSNCAII